MIDYSIIGAITGFGGGLVGTTIGISEAAIATAAGTSIAGPIGWGVGIGLIFAAAIAYTFNKLRGD